jgi:uncharacterized membrane protein
MRKYIRNLVILISPFLLMIIVNEVVRPTIREKPYSNYGITAINSADKNTEKCTWICHNNTTYCRNHHVRYLKNHYAYTDTIYFGIIGLLAKTGNYGLANIIFLVILLPLLIWLFIIKSLNIQDKINKLKKKQ